MYIGSVETTNNSDTLTHTHLHHPPPHTPHTSTPTHSHIHASLDHTYTPRINFILTHTVSSIILVYKLILYVHVCTIQYNSLYNNNIIIEDLAVAMETVL